MKEGKLLNRVQAVIPYNYNLILATIQEHSLKSESSCFIHTNDIQQLATQIIKHF
jgi:hypothetical protein